MALDTKLQVRIEAMAKELLRDLYGPKGYPAWGTKFAEIEEQTGEVGDAIAYRAHRAKKPSAGSKQDPQ